MIGFFKRNWSILLCVVIVGILLFSIHMGAMSSLSLQNITTQSVDVELWKSIFFLDVLRGSINHLLANFRIIWLGVGILAAIFNRDAIVTMKEEAGVLKLSKITSVKKKITSHGRVLTKIIKHFSRYFLGLFWVAGAWYIVSLRFKIMEIPENLTRDKVGTWKDEISNLQELGVELGLENFYELGIVNNITYIQNFVGIFLLSLIVLAGLISTLSFGNKVWRGTSSFLLLLAFLLGVAAIFFHFLSVELTAGLGV